jgi:hypothetical protein
MFTILVNKPWVGVKWTCWVICFYGTIGRVTGNCAESHQFFNNALSIDSSWPLWTYEWYVLTEQLAECLGIAPSSWPLCHMKCSCTLQCEPSHLSRPWSFYRSPMCVVPMVTIFVIKPRVWDKWTRWVICLGETIGRVPRDCVESYSSIRVSGYNGW